MTLRQISGECGLPVVRYLRACYEVCRMGFAGIFTYERNPDDPFEYPGGTTAANCAARVDAALRTWATDLPDRARAALDASPERP